MFSAFRHNDSRAREGPKVQALLTIPIESPLDALMPETPMRRSILSLTLALTALAGAAQAAPSLVVPIDQSRMMATALRRAGKPVELVELDGEDHWLSRGDTRTRMLAETVRFLQANNPPD